MMERLDPDTFGNAEARKLAIRLNFFVELEVVYESLKKNLQRPLKEFPRGSVCMEIRCMMEKVDSVIGQIDKSIEELRYSDNWRIVSSFNQFKKSLIYLQGYGKRVTQESSGQSDRYYYQDVGHWWNQYLQVSEIASGMIADLAKWPVR